MTSRKLKRQNRRAFNRARLEVGDGEQVCATMTAEGEPVYFIMPVDATDEDVRARAFQERNGRAMSRVERTLLELAEREVADA